MESFRKDWSPHPREKSNFLSVIFFTWIARIFREDRKKVISTDNIWGPCSPHRSDILGDQLEEVWMKQVEKKKTEEKKDKKSVPSLVVAIFFTFWADMLWISTMHLVTQLIDVFLRPSILAQLIAAFTSGVNDPLETSLLAVQMLAVSFFLCLMNNHYLFSTGTLGMKMRAAVVSVVYRKCLRLSKATMRDVSPGQVVNLVSNDVGRFEQVNICINFLWSGPMQTIIVAFLLYNELGVLGFAGMSIIAFVATLQTYTAELTSRFRRKIARECDKRITLTDEILAGIHVIKMYAWEKPFVSLLNIARNRELKFVRSANTVRAVYMMFNITTTRVALFVTISTYVLSGYNLSAAQIFKIGSYYGILAQTMTSVFVRGVAEVAECRVSLSRLQNFLLQQEVEGLNERVEEKPEIDKEITQNGDTETQSRNAVTVKDVEARWMKDNANPDLNDISLAIRKGQLLAVIGTVGSGKSSLLQLLLGELNVKSGKINVCGEISYASQEPWIFGGTVRDNILLGLPYNRIRYKQVIAASSLERDMDLFPDGDQTMVGERGAALSGGQRARINLARAIYKEADIYLLDDPLSAVDTHVAKDLFNTCIKRFLKGKTVLLATHQLQFLSQMDKIVLLQQGRIKDIGKLSDLIAHGHDFTMIADGQQLSEENKESTEKQNPRRLSRMISEQRLSLSRSLDDMTVIERDVMEENSIEGDDKASVNEKYQGNCYLDYLKTGNALLLFSTFVFFAFSAQFFASATDLWMSQWAKELDKTASNSTDREENIVIAGYVLTENEYYVSVYGTLNILLFICAFLRGIAFVFSSIKCSRRLHAGMVKSALYTDISYFNNNPSGTILNKFSRDLGSTDELLPKGVLDMAQTFGMVVGAVVNTMIVNYFLLFPILVFMIVATITRNYCLRTSLNIKRNENISRGPVYTHLNTSLQGLTTIRAHGSQRYLTKSFNLHQDLNTSCFYTYLACTQGYGFSLDLVSCVYQAVVIFSCIFWNAGMSGADVGLAITQTMQVTGMLQWGLRMSSEVANVMTSVERLLLFLRLQPEESEEDSQRSPPPNWPAQGNIEFQDLSLSFTKTSPPILKNVSITINAGEKIGIVGRTGAGKSSLSTALFRLAPTEGRILIDDVDTAAMSLRSLRSALAIIPQNPILYSGNLRENLDPFGEYPDYELWKALGDTDIEELMGDKLGLDSKISDGGSNLSVGQRQLICLARAVVKNRKIIVLDEATASVDPETDALLQATIRKKFANCTVLTIAHRLNTIMDSDRILVMDSGRKVEMDSPFNLLQMKGYFYSLVQECGPVMATKLIELATEKHLSKNRAASETDKKEL